MNTHPYVVAGLATFDLFVVIRYYVHLRSHIPDRRDLMPVAAGLTAFAILALLFFNGAFLFLQLATIASVFGLHWVFSLRNRKNES